MICATSYCCELLPNYSAPDDVHNYYNTVLAKD